MIDVSVITQQLVEWLRNDSELDGHVVSRGEPVNQSASDAVNGWIGVYRRTLDYDPRNLGVPPNNYEADLVFTVIVQRSNLESGASCEDDLEKSVKAVLDRVVQIPRTHIDTFTDIQIDYTYIETDRLTMFFQGALVTFTARVSDEVSS